jgi:ribose transport system substrate-binding protein
MARRTSALVIGIALVFALGSCAKKPSTGPTSPAKQPVPTGRTLEGKVIGVTLLTKGHEFYKDLEAGLREAAAEKGCELLVDAGEWDLQKQQSQIENFITRKVDAIIVCPVDSKGIGTAVDQANQASIPVFTADIAAEEGKVVCHIASDNVKGGETAATYMGEHLKSGEVAVIDQPIVTSVIDRVNGFEQKLKDYPGLKIVVKQSGEGVRDKAMNVTENILQAHPGIKGIFAINDDSALGALQAVRAAGKEKQIIIVGYDATPEAREEILAGSALKADVIQYPKKIGRETIEAIAKHLAGEPLPPKIPVEVGIVDKAALEAEPGG